MGLLFGTRPRLTEVTNLNDKEAYGLSFVGNGYVNLEIFQDIQIPLQEIRREIIATQDPIDIKFIVDTS